MLYRRSPFLTRNPNLLHNRFLKGRDGLIIPPYPIYYAMCRHIDSGETGNYPRGLFTGKGAMQKYQ